MEDDNNDTATYKTRTELDIRGNTVKVTNELGQETIYAYAPVSLANMSQEEEPREMPVFTDSPDSGFRCMLNNAAGILQRTWDERGHEIYNEYDELLRIEKVWLGPSGSENLVNLLEYGESQGSTDNLKGQLYRQHDQSGRLTNVKFDFKGNLLELERQLCEDYENLIDWNASPTLKTETFTTLNTYDALNRLKTLTQPDNTEIQYTYNKAGLLETVKAKLRGAGSATDFVDNINYNEKGQRKKIEYANDSQTAYTYDPLTFRLKKISTDRDSDGNYVQKIEYFYDALGNIVYMQDDAHEPIYYDNDVIDPVNKYYYDALNRLTKATGRELANLWSGTPPNEADFVNSINCPNPDPNAMQNYTNEYTYDQIGNITQIRSLGDWTRDYLYDGAMANNYLGGHSNPNEYNYDIHGNCTVMPHIAELKWDFRDRFKEADLGGGGTAYYTYDAAGERVSKVIELSSGVLKQTIYLSGYEVYREYANATEYQNDNVDKERETIHVMDDKRRIALVQTLTVTGGSPVGSPTEVIKYQLDNHLGSACIELDTSANVISYEEYHPFGTTSYRSGPNSAEVSLKKYKYVGKERDDETGLYYYGARYYAPWTCRFISVDPLAHSYPYLTPYNYAGNKPITHKDIDGLQSTGDEPVDGGGGNGQGGNGQGSNATTQKTEVHAVKSGETLSGIAEQYGTTVDALSQANNISNPDYIQAGQELNVPSSSSTQQAGDNLTSVKFDFSILETPQDNTRVATTPMLDFFPAQGGDGGGFDASGLGKAFVGGGLSVGSDVLNGSTVRFFNQKGTNFSPKLYTSGWKGGSAGQIKTYGTSNTATGLRGLGYGLGVYNAVSIEQQYQSGEINNFQRTTEQTSNAISTFGGIYGAAWGIGWEMGRAITNIPGYKENVREPIQRALGIIPPKQECQICPLINK